MIFQNFFHEFFISYLVEPDLRASFWKVLKIIEIFLSIEDFIRTAFLHTILKSKKLRYLFKINSNCASKRYRFFLFEISVSYLKVLKVLFWKGEYITKFIFLKF